MLSVASADSSSLLSTFFLDRILLTHFDVVRNRYVALSMPNAVSKLPFLAAGVTAAELSVVQFPTAGELYRPWFADGYLTIGGGLNGDHVNAIRAK